jgi:hypothetical protein
MQDLKARREKYLFVAGNCDMIADHATDPQKRELFAKLAMQLKQIAGEIGAEIVTRQGRDAALAPAGQLDRGQAAEVGIPVHRHRSQARM